MSDETKNAEQPAEPVEETRVDEFALGIFRAMGYTDDRLPDRLVSAYNEVKRRKDGLQPGRLSPEGFAFVTMIADMAGE